jgi:hypothetical protein
MAVAKASLEKRYLNEKTVNLSVLVNRGLISILWHCQHHVEIDDKFFSARFISMVLA